MPDMKSKYERLVAQFAAYENGRTNQEPTMSHSEACEWAAMIAPIELDRDAPFTLHDKLQTALGFYHSDLIKAWHDDAPQSFQENMAQLYADVYTASYTASVKYRILSGVVENLDVSQQGKIIGFMSRTGLNLAQAKRATQMLEMLATEEKGRILGPSLDNRLQDQATLLFGSKAEKAETRTRLNFMEAHHAICDLADLHEWPRRDPITEPPML